MSQKYPGGLITKSPITPSGPYETSTASGIWTLDQQAYWRNLNQWPIAGSVVPDPQFNYVTMLLHGDGTNGAQNNTFLDSSINNFTITRNGNTTQGSFSPYGSNWSNYFDGSGDYLTVADNTALDLGSSDFTLECWLYSTVGTSNECVINKGYNSSQSYLIFLDANTAGFFGSSNGSTFDICSNASIGSVPKNTWTHLAVCRSGSSIRLFNNGALITTVTSSASFSNSADNFIIGSSVAGSFYYNGYLSNVRLVKGTALYTSAFTPSTTPLTAITNTSLLTCQSNRFIDNSANNFTVTATGNTSVQRFNPFGTSTAYSTSVIGGSGYFDGTGDSLTVAASSAFAFGTGDFSVQFWVYFTAATADNQTVVELRPMRLIIGRKTNNKARIYVPNTDQNNGNNGPDIPNNAWTHFSVARTGTTMYVYINGVSAFSFSSTDNFSSNPSISIGRNDDVAEPMIGYVSDVRILKGTYNVTLPTAPYTAITNTSLLLSMTNAAIFDNAMMNDLETVGNAQISTSVVKYGTGSMYFDGSAYLFEPSNQANTLGAGDFTMEAWIYPIGVNGSICEKGYGLANGFLFWYQSGQIRIRTYNGSLTQTNIFASGVINTDVWQHVAAVRYSGTITLYVNGTSVASGADTDNLSSTDNFQIGAYDGYTLPVQGYIDDLRITKYARYTANFTPPTAAFPNIGPT
jgi:hypothetical protein